MNARGDLNGNFIKRSKFDASYYVLNLNSVLQSHAEKLKLSLMIGVSLNIGLSVLEGLFSVPFKTRWRNDFNRGLIIHDEKDYIEKH